METARLLFCPRGSVVCSLRRLLTSKQMAGSKAHHTEMNRARSSGVTSCAQTGINEGLSGIGNGCTAIHANTGGLVRLREAEHGIKRFRYLLLSPLALGAGRGRATVLL